ncbi:hypothetical protein ACFQZX_16085 [Mucilaginibacter litoreus]|uniref:Uncharacterized protein n=1 Tax=Mucilaginibacter litoreus TaxID=1048221 RepID=A0ABW3AW33_9SPHI
MDKTADNAAVKKTNTIVLIVAQPYLPGNTNLGMTRYISIYAKNILGIKYMKVSGEVMIKRWRNDCRCNAGEGENE